MKEEIFFDFLFVYPWKLEIINLKGEHKFEEEEKCQPHSFTNIRPIGIGQKSALLTVSKHGGEDEQ